MDILYIKSRLRRFTADKHLIDELCQQVMIKCIGKEINDKYMNLVIRSVFIDYFRQKKRTFQELDVNTELKTDYINSKVIFEQIEKLNQKQKETIILKYYFNIKLKKIAKLFNIPYNTALGINHEAKKNLRILLNQKHIKNELF